MAGSNLMFERCKKVIQVDDYSLMAVAGVPAIVRYTENSYKFWSEDRLTRLESMSREEK